MSYDQNDGSYLGNWGNQKAKQVANQVDHIADKAKFAIDMVNNALISLDSIEKELKIAASAPNPPTPQTLLAFAARIDTAKDQVTDGLQKVKDLMVDIDKTTNRIQDANGWNV